MKSYELRSTDRKRRRGVLGLIQYLGARPRRPVQIQLLLFLMAWLLAYTLANASTPGTVPFAFFGQALHPQTGVAWTWMSGSNDINQSGTYGTQGVVSASNVPGARESTRGWADGSGGLWMFGGYGYDSAGTIDELNDLWRFDTSSLQWQWVSGSNVVDQPGVYGTKGTQAPANVPGARDSFVTWTDSSGNFWLFGGWGYDSAGTYGYLNDLWRFSPVAKQWTWMSGTKLVNGAGTFGTKGTAAAANVPPSKNEASSWSDSSGRLWLFSGRSTVLSANDLWNYNIASGQWTWVWGSNTNNLAAGNYGTKGVASASNAPSTRDNASTWIDGSGNLYMFGGNGYAFNGVHGLLQDLWKYDPTSGLWTWVSGNKAANFDAVSGKQGVASVNYYPGCKVSTFNWADSLGNLLLYGGADACGGSSFVNDAWSYETSSTKWTWVSGTLGASSPPTGTYGTRNLWSNSNLPGLHSDGVSWTDSNGNFWLFGGSGWGTSTTSGFLNDVWEFQVLTKDPPSQTLISGPVSVSPAQCAPYVVSRKTANGVLSYEAATTSVSLSAGAGAFYSDSGCGAGIAATSIGGWTFQTTVYFKMPAVQTATLQAAASGLTTGSVTVNAPYQLAWNATSAIATGQCVSATITSQTSLGDSVATPSDINVTLSGNGLGSFYGAAGCSSSVITTITIPSGSNQATVWFNDASAESLVWSAAATGLTSATAAVSTNNAPTHLAWTGSSQALASVCVSATITLLDASSAVTNALLPTTITLGGNGLGTFSAGAGCSGSVASVVVPAGSSSATVSFFSAAKQDLIWTADSSGLTQGTLAVRVGQSCMTPLASGTSWTVPSDYQASSSKIEAIGGGGGGHTGAAGSGAGGGAGGSYAAAVAVALTPGSNVAYGIGTGGVASAGGSSYFCNSTLNCGSIAGTAVVVGASGGATGGTSAGGVGATTGNIGVSVAGGSGAARSSTKGGGGGGAGGRNAAGSAGSGQTGGTGDGTFGGVGGAAGANGSAGTEWSASYGSGGGGGGGIAAPGGSGALYGAGGGGGGSTTQVGGAGANGLIVVTYFGLTCS